MVYKLSHDEVLKICATCTKFVRDGELCRVDTGGGPKSLKELHRCKKWDEHFGSACVY